MTANDREKYATYTRDNATGLDYAMNRYYASAWGRFLSPDPSGRSIHLKSPQSWNRYGYASNDPANGTDPTGAEAGRDYPYVEIDEDDPEPEPHSDEGFFFELDFGFGWSWNGPGVGQGVGSGSTTGAGGVPKVTNYSTTSRQAVGVQNSLRVLQQALQQDQTCSGWLTGNQDLINTLVGNTSSGTVYVGTGDFSSSGTDVTNAIAGSPLGTNLPVGALLTVNLDGAFFSTSVTTGYQGDVGGGTDLAKAFILLHELAHLASAAGFAPNDSSATAAGRQNQDANNKMVEQKCATTLDLFGGRF